MTTSQSPNNYSASHWQMQTPHGYNASIVSSTDLWGRPINNSPRFSQPENVMTELFKECPIVGSIFYKDKGPGRYIVNDSDPRLREVMSELSKMLNNYRARGHIKERRVPSDTNFLDSLSNSEIPQSSLEDTVGDISKPEEPVTYYAAVVSGALSLQAVVHYSMSNGKGIQFYIKGDRREYSPRRSKPQFKKRFGKRR